MEELKQQVRQLIQMQKALSQASHDQTHLKQKLDDLEQVKERYREETIHLRQKLRH